MHVHNESGWTSLGDLSSFVILIESAKTSAKEIFEIYQDTMKTTTYVQKAFNLIERGSKIEAGVGTTLDKSNVIGHVELRGVTFSYPSRPSATVLRDVSIVLMPGRVTAICGASGGGWEDGIYLNSIVLFLFNINKKVPK